jgi:mRNA interferase MazF
MHSTNTALTLFDQWSHEKQVIHRSEEIKASISPRGVWYIKMGLNIGNEQNGKGDFRRPVLVIRRIWNMYFCIPLTTKWKDKNFFYLPLDTRFEEKSSWIIVSQGRVYDKKRFIEFIWKIWPEEFHNIKKSLREIYFWETWLLPSEEGGLHRDESR